MEPGDYATNVLSINNFATVRYDYFELQSGASRSSRHRLPKIEASWRRSGTLVHHDSVGNGLWCFYPETSATDSQKLPRPTSLPETQDGTLVLKSQGTYEPSKLSGKQAQPAQLGFASTNSSPSSSFEGAARSAQLSNTRAVQPNATQGVGTESPTPSSSRDVSLLKSIHERFISAALFSIVFFLCRDHGYTPVNARTLLVTASSLIEFEQHNDSLHLLFSSPSIASLDISLTSLGTMVVKAQVTSVPGLRTLSVPYLKEVAQGSELWLGPGGHAARFYSAIDGNQLPLEFDDAHLLTNTPSRQLRYDRSDTFNAWRSACLDWLADKGLNSRDMDSDGWILVQMLEGSQSCSTPDPSGSAILGDANIIPWPSRLCFHVIKEHSLEEIPYHLSGSQDPLTFAQQWFAAQEDRAKNLLRHKKERQMAEAASKDKQDGEPRPIHASNFSPVVLRRGSNAGAIYPTPPDVIQQTVGVTPSFDGTASTPGNPNLFLSSDGEANKTTMRHSNGDKGTWDGADNRTQQAKPNVQFQENRNEHVQDENQYQDGEQNQVQDQEQEQDQEQDQEQRQEQDHDNDNDNLFEGMGGDLFGDTDITDADFSFFDEPDAMPMQQTETSKMTLESEGNGACEVLATPSGLEESSAMIRDHVPRFDNAAELPVAQQEKQLTDSIDHSNTTHELTSQTKDEKLIVFKTPLPPSRSQTPFSKETVFRLLSRNVANGKKDRDTTGPGLKSRRASAFNKVEFDSLSLALDEKYSARGRFNYSEDIQVHKNTASDLPKTDYFQQQKRAKLHHDRASSAHMFGPEDFENVHDLSGSNSDSAADSGTTSPSSEQGITSPMKDIALVSSYSDSKRKRDVDENNDDPMATTFNTSRVGSEQSIKTPKSVTEPASPAFMTDAADWSLTPFLKTPSPVVQPTILSDAEYVATAQILTDQAVSNLFSICQSTRKDLTTKTCMTSTTKRVLRDLLDAAKAFLENVVACSMRNYLEIQGIPALNQALRLPPRPMPHPRGLNPADSSRTSYFPLPIPRLEVRRSETNLTILPTAISFWDNLGLGPAQGAKAVVAVCIHPAVDGMARRASEFIDEMKSAYESHRFGSHERLAIQDSEPGLLPLAIDSQQTSHIYTLAIVKEAMTKLSQMLLASTSGEEKNYVVYCLYPDNHSGLLLNFCSAFEHLFNLYRRGLSERKTSMNTELVLQLVPLKFVASSTALMVPEPSEYARLAMEVYDRCMEFNTSCATPAVLLERPLPKNIDFKLSPTPSPSLLQENSCIHVAYAQSIDDRWITAAWTDNRGTQQMTASYCLGRINEPIFMQFSDVAHEIWQTTLGILSHKKIHWRLMIVKAGVMDLSEIEFWTGLASTESEAHVNLTLVSVDTEPSLQLLPEPLRIIPTASNGHSVLTPVSTPQAGSIVSPDNAATPIRDQAANPPTPNEAPVEPDSDARLVDLTDQTWGAVLSHRLNNSKSLLEFNPAIISGYLVKRSGTSNVDPPVILEINIMHSDFIGGNPRTFHESLLREVMVYYRGLATIARVRGVTDGVQDGRPWHIAAAQKAVHALYMLM